MEVLGHYRLRRFWRKRHGALHGLQTRGFPKQFHMCGDGAAAHWTV